MQAFDVMRLPEVDQQMLKRGLCPWCVTRLVEDGKDDVCPGCGDKFVGTVKDGLD